MCAVKTKVQTLFSPLSPANSSHVGDSLCSQWCGQRQLVRKTWSKSNNTPRCDQGHQKLLWKENRVPFVGHHKLNWANYSERMDLCLKWFICILRKWVKSKAGCATSLSALLVPVQACSKHIYQTLLQTLLRLLGNNLHDTKGNLKYIFPSLFIFLNTRGIHPII